jgi:myo-inositol-1-phosphate synthase
LIRSQNQRKQSLSNINNPTSQTLDFIVGYDHRAAGVIIASKHAPSAASRASHCYVAISALATGLNFINFSPVFIDE